MFLGKVAQAFISHQKGACIILAGHVNPPPPFISVDAHRIWVVSWEGHAQPINFPTWRRSGHFRRVTIENKVDESQARLPKPLRYCYCGQKASSSSIKRLFKKKTISFHARVRDCWNLNTIWFSNKKIIPPTHQSFGRVKLPEWPPECPDLNPIGVLWTIPKSWVAGKQTNLNNIQSLCQDQCSNILPDFCQKFANDSQNLVLGV